jgi:hypothetical protein
MTCAAGVRRFLVGRLGFAVVLAGLPLSGQLAAQHSSGQLGDAGSPPPGLLESFLRGHKEAKRTEQTIGVLTGNGSAKATFVAVVAWDPAEPERKVRGLLIRLEDSARTGTAYVDDDRDEQSDNLRGFEKSVIQLETPRSEEAQRMIEGRQESAGAWVITTGAQNRPGTQETYCCPRHNAMNVGWFGTKDRGIEGVTIDIPNPPPTPGSPRVSGRYYFHGATLSQFVDLIAKTRDFLKTQ